MTATRKGTKVPRYRCTIEARKPVSFVDTPLDPIVERAAKLSIEEDREVWFRLCSSETSERRTIIVDARCARFDTRSGAWDFTAGTIKYRLDQADGRLGKWRTWRPLPPAPE